MGGDEFCVLFKGTPAAEREIARASVAALSEDGPGFTIGAAHGEVSIPAKRANLPTCCDSPTSACTSARIRRANSMWHDTRARAVRAPALTRRS